MSNKKISRYWTSIILVGALMGFFPVYFMVPFWVLLDVLNAIAVSIGIGVLVAYAKGFFASLNGKRTKNFDGLTAGHLLIAGITLVWSAVIIRLVWSWAAFFFGFPQWMSDFWLVAFAVWAFIIGGVLHLTASNAIENEIPRSNWTWVGFLVAMGALLGIVLARFGLGAM